MKREIINSSIIDSFGYDPNTRVLEVELTENKEVRRYLEVPAEVWKAFYAASSRGKYFLKNIKSKYRKEGE
jgi:hypothetical protein